MSGRSGLVDGRYAWTIFTSVNAGPRGVGKVRRARPGRPPLRRCQIACIGEATADAVRSFGIQPKLIPAGEQTSEGLLAEFSPHDEILDPSAGGCCLGPTSPPKTLAPD